MHWKKICKKIGKILSKNQNINDYHNHTELLYGANVCKISILMDCCFRAENVMKPSEHFQNEK